MQGHSCEQGYEARLREGLHLLPLQQLLQAAHHIQGRGRRRWPQGRGCLRRAVVQRKLQRMLLRLAVVRGFSCMQQRPCACSCDLGSPLPSSFPTTENAQNRPHMLFDSSDYLRVNDQKA